MKNLPAKLAASNAIKIRNRLGLVNGGRVLDVATGTGDFIDTLMKALKDYDCFVGIDISNEELESTRKRFKNQPVEVRKMNAKSLEFDDESFDTVSMAYSLHHIDGIDKALAEMERILKPTGHLIIQEEFCDGEQTEAQRTDTLQHAWGAEIDSMLGQTHKSTFSRQMIREAIKDLKLEAVEIFESTRPVECLFCERSSKCENPMSEEEVQRSIKEIDDDLRRLEDIRDPEARVTLRRKGNDLKERVRKFGKEHPSLLFVIGRKASKV